MVYRKVYKVTNGSLNITIPPAFKDKQVVVTIDDAPVSQKDKLSLMEKAANDPLYLADLNEVNDDFKGIDHETL